MCCLEWFPPIFWIAHVLLLLNHPPQVGWCILVDEPHAVPSPNHQVTLHCWCYWPSEQWKWKQWEWYRPWKTPPTLIGLRLPLVAPSKFNLTKPLGGLDHVVVERCWEEGLCLIEEKGICSSFRSLKIIFFAPCRSFASWSQRKEIINSWMLVWMVCHASSKFLYCCLKFLRLCSFQIVHGKNPGKYSRLYLTWGCRMDLCFL